MKIEMEPEEELSFKKIKDDSSIVKTVPAVKAEFLENCVRVDLGQGFTKLVEYSDFEKVFSEMIGRKETTLKESELILPPNVAHIKYSSTDLKILCYYPEGIRDITYMTETKERIFPNILIAHSLSINKSSWKVNNSIFLCTDLPLSRLERKFINKPDASKRIYILPFSNMYDSGAMCTGQNQLPRAFEKNDMRGLHQYYEMIFNSPFNNDLGVKALSRDSLYREASTWFGHLADIAKKPNPKFPYKEISGFVKDPHVIVPVPEPVTLSNTVVPPPIIIQPHPMDEDIRF